MIDIQSILFYLILPGFIIYAGFSDCFRMKISNKLCGLILLSFVMFCVLTPPMWQWSALSGHIMAFAITFAIAFILFALGLIGGGDAKFVSALSLWFGSAHSFDFLVNASLIGAVLTLVILVLRSKIPYYISAKWDWSARLMHPRSGIPYGIALSIGAMMAYEEAFLPQAMAL